MMMKTQIGRVGARVALGAALALAPTAAVAGVAAAAPVSAGPAAASAHAGTFTATDGWYYWHCIRHHEFWRPACQGPGPYEGPGPYGPPPSGSLGAYLNVGV